MSEPVTSATPRSRRASALSGAPTESGPPSVEAGASFTPLAPARSPWRRWQWVAAVGLAIALLCGLWSMWTSSRQTQMQAQQAVLENEWRQAAMEVSAAVQAGDVNALQAALTHGDQVRDRIKRGQGPMHQASWSSVWSQWEAVHTAVSAQGAISTLPQAVRTFDRALNDSSSADWMDQGRQGLPWAVGASALLALVFIALLVWAQAQHQKWARQETLAAQEGTDEALVGLLAYLQALKGGDLSRRALVSASNIGTLADAINEVVQQWGAGVRKGQKESDVAQASASRLQQALQHLTHRMTMWQQNAADRRGRVRDQLASALRQALPVQEWSDALVAVESRLTQVNAANDSLQTRWEQARAHVQEAELRSHRVNSAMVEVEQLTNTLNEIAEHTAVMSVQAGILAAKAGERGAGFHRVADALRGLAEQSSESARRVGSVLKSAQADGHSTSASLKASLLDADEGARLNDVALEDGSNALERLEEVRKTCVAWMEANPTSSSALPALDQALAHDAQEVAAWNEFAEDAGSALSEWVEVARQSQDRLRQFRV